MRLLRLFVRGSFREQVCPDNPPHACNVYEASNSPSLVFHLLVRSTANMSVSESLEKLKEILRGTRNIQLAHDHDHTYDDKFALVEFLTNSTWQSLGRIFEQIGLDFQTEASEVVLYFERERKCAFLQEKKVEIKSGESTDTTVLGVTVASTRTTKQVTQFHWKLTESYALYACLDSCESNRVMMRQRSMSTTVITTAKEKPRRAILPLSTIEFNITAMAQLALEQNHFTIDRSLDSCRTPRRNSEVESVLQFHRKLYAWLKNIQQQLEDLWFDGPPNDGFDLRAAATLENENTLPFPVLMENSTLLSDADLHSILTHDDLAMENAHKHFLQIHPPPEPGTMMSVDEVFLYHILTRAKKTMSKYAGMVLYVEEMLEKQLLEAVGPTGLRPHDLGKYMQFHNQRLFGSDFAPKQFSRSVRLPGRTPVGMVSIETEREGPIQTITRRIRGEGNPAIRIPMDASSFVEMTGDRFLSGWMRYEFQGSDNTGSTSLIARAKQFSSFMLMVGTMKDGTTFEPTHAIILQNKDEVMIPLLTSVLPSVKEFKDSIRSLSPEQQEFARAFRAMQLQSSLFAICIIQLKPQLEKLLHLPEGSLAKEIQLTEDLMTLFVDYQIPADVLSYDGEHDKPVSEKVTVVKQYVEAVMSMLRSLKEDQKADEDRKADMRRTMSDEQIILKSSISPSSYSGSMPSSSSSRTSPSASPSSAPVGPTASPHLSSASSSYPSAATPPEEILADAYDEEIPGRSKAPSSEDVTLIPGLLEAKLDRFDIEGYLKPTLIVLGQQWRLLRQANLLSPQKGNNLDETAISSERSKAMDLLDAISRGGSLAIESAELHVIVAATHGFEHSILDTLIKDNINPIVKAEVTNLLMASVIHGEEAVSAMIGEQSHVDRLSEIKPDLFSSLPSDDASASRTGTDADDDNVDTTRTS